MASGKAIAFGIFKRNGCVYTEVVPDCEKATLHAVICGRVAPEAVTHSDGWRGHDGMVDDGYAKHSRGNHGAKEFARGGGHVNGIEGFRGGNLYRGLLRLLRNDPLRVSFATLEAIFF